MESNNNDDVLSLYFQDMDKSRKKNPRPTREEERNLALRAQRGDEEAAHQLVQQNLGFVVFYVKRYQYQGLSLSDLIAEGNLGLMKALRKFDPDNNEIKFISYAVWWIAQAVLEAISKQSGDIRIPLNQKFSLRKLWIVQERLRQKLGREPTMEEMAAADGITVEEVADLLANVNQHLISVDAPVGDNATVGDRIEEESVADEMAIKNDVRERIDAALNTLVPRERKVVILYFGLDGGGSRTLEAIGAKIGVTRERVRQIRDRALNKLRTVRALHLLV